MIFVDFVRIIIEHEFRKSVIRAGKQSAARLDKNAYFRLLLA